MLQRLHSNSYANTKLAINGGEKSVSYPKPHFKWPILGTEEERLVLELLRDSNISVYGKEGVVAQLEDEFAKYCNVQYSLSTNSGTSALFAAFFALNLKQDDEVIVPTYTFPATVTPLLHLPVKIVLCDSNPTTGNVEAKSISACLSSKTKAVVVTHMWGLPCPMDDIVELCKKNKLMLIEDASHALGAKYKGHLVGSFGDIGCFSLQGNKMACAGEGGILITNNTEYYERATLFTSFRKRPYETVKSPYYHQFWETGFGLKLKIHPIAAAIALQQLRKTDNFIKMRHERLDLLSEFLKESPGIEPPIKEPNSFRGAWYGFKPLFRKEDFSGIPIDYYIDALKAEGLQIHKPGTKPLHQTHIFSNYSNPKIALEGPKSLSINQKPKIAEFPGADSYYSRALSIPTFTIEPLEIIEAYGKAFQKVGYALERL